jgi:hypothetical protein
MLLSRSQVRRATPGALPAEASRRCGISASERKARSERILNQICHVPDMHCNVVSFPVTGCRPQA